MGVTHMLSTFTVLVIVLVCFNVVPFGHSHRQEEIFEYCPIKVPGFPDEKVTNTGYESSVEKFIINGKVEDVKKFPFTVQLHATVPSGLSKYTCSASIISKRFVLSAAHCYINDSRVKTFILAGSNKLNDGDRYDIEEWKIHPSYKKYGDETSHFLDADVAVLRTSKEIQFTQSVQAVKLPTPAEEIVTGTLVNILGWGKLSEFDNDVSAVLMRVDLPLLSDKNCKRAYRNKYTTYMICAGYKKGRKGPCRGDSGGPLVINGTLFGITSWVVVNHECSVPNCPSIFAKVREVVDWIKSITGKQI